MIGVAPDQQRRGRGQQLLHEILERAARAPDSRGVALDTENPDNVPLYQPRTRRCILAVAPALVAHHDLPRRTRVGAARASLDQVTTDPALGHLLAVAQMAVFAIARRPAGDPREEHPLHVEHDVARRERQ